jgi:hypothetical protein
LVNLASFLRSQLLQYRRRGIHYEMASSDGYSLRHPTMSTVLALASILLAWIVMGVISPADSDAAASRTMQALACGGMLIGLSVDASGASSLPLVLTSLCGSLVATGFLGALRLHWMLLPSMHLGMAVSLFASAVLLCRRLDRRRFGVIAQNFLCSACMLAGMTAGSLCLLHSQTIGSIAWWSMLSAMIAGMSWGMVASAGLWRIAEVASAGLWQAMESGWPTRCPSKRALHAAREWHG